MHKQYILSGELKPGVVLPLLEAESRRPNNNAFNLASVSWGEFFIPVAVSLKYILNLQQDFFFFKT